MTAIAWPAALQPAQVEFSLRRQVAAFRSPGNGFFQAVDLLSELWQVQITFPAALDGASGALEVLIHQLVGGAQTVLMHPLHRPEPVGTLRGSPTLASTAAQFANSFSITGATPGATLRAGDFFGLGGQLFQVAADVTMGGGGTATVTTVNRARASIASASAMTLVRPTAEFAALDQASALVFTRDGLAGPAISLVEVA